MPNLRYTPEAFGYMGVAFARPTEITFSWEELGRAAITVGRRRWADVSQFGTYSVLEAMWRAGMLRANLVEELNGRLRKSGAFVNLDPSEKSAVSYFLGATAAKLISERLFGVAWLLHFDVYRQYLSPTMRFFNKPDFVGLNSSAHWVVIEAKGRTNGANSELIETAKKQTRSLRQVGGQMPVLRAAVVMDFANGYLRVRVRDPDEFDPGAADVSAEAHELVRAYYRPLVRSFNAYHMKGVRILQRGNFTYGQPSLCLTQQLNLTMRFYGGTKSPMLHWTNLSERCHNPCKCSSDGRNTKLWMRTKSPPQSLIFIEKLSTSG